MGNNLTKYQKVDRLVLKISYVVAMLILVALVVWGIVKIIGFYKYEETNDAQVKEYINPILSRTSGYVQEIRYTDHQQIKKGDTLVILDSNEALVNLAKVKAEIASAESQLDVLEHSIRACESGADIHKSKISAAKAELWKQQKDFERYKNLLEVEAVTQQQFEEAQTRLDIAKSNYEAAQNTYINSQDKTADEESKVIVAKANLAQKKALLANVELDLKYTVILAPSDGYMGTRSLQVGQLVQKGQVIGFMVDKKQGKWVVANFLETQIADMHEGQKAKITVDAYPGEEFMGEIESFSPAAGSQFSLLPPDNATGNFVKVTQRIPVKLVFTNDNPMLGKLKAGMNAEVSVIK